MDPTIQIIAENLAAGGRNIFFTGAGISTESGIPDYRSQGGLWQKYEPVYFDDFMARREARVEYWRRQAESHPAMHSAIPNPAHRAIFELFELGLVEAVITQNIDGLHHRSGLPHDRIIELHGNALRVRCMGCGELSAIESAIGRVNAGDLAPECACGGYLKPDTVSFGQAMPAGAVARAVALSGECDCFCVVGSTLLVQPAAKLPVIAKQAGAFLGIFNLSETPCDEICDARVSAQAGRALPETVSAVLAIRRPDGYQKG